MTKHLQPGDMLLMDAGIFCYRMAKQTKTQNAEFLARSQLRTLEPIRKLADGSYLAKIYSHNNHRRLDKNGMVVRVINYRLNDPSGTGYQGPRRLITSLLDATEHPASELVALYHERWSKQHEQSQPMSIEYPSVAQYVSSAAACLNLPTHLPPLGTISSLPRWPGRSSNYVATELTHARTPYGLEVRRTPCDGLEVRRTPCDGLEVRRTMSDPHHCFRLVRTGAIINPGRFYLRKCAKIAR